MTLLLRARKKFEVLGTLVPRPGGCTQHKNSLHILFFKIPRHSSQVWWYTPVIPALGRQEAGEFKASLGYMARACLTKKKKKKSTEE
jgi:hypothetical protein